MKDGLSAPTMLEGASIRFNVVEVAKKEAGRSSNGTDGDDGDGDGSSDSNIITVNGALLEPGYPTNNATPNRLPPELRCKKKC